MNLSSVPVIYYHSVKHKVNNNWIHPYITMPLNLFQRHMKLIKNLGMKTIFMDDLYSHLNGEKKLPFNALNIHFDDGYLDNFVFAFPLLKKYKLKATIWVNPEFVDNSDRRIRPTLEDYWNGNKTLNELNEYDGVLNWEEMKLMEQSGLVEIQSHTMTHTKYPISDKIVDFYSPTTKIDWLHWNLFPEDKPYFFTKSKKDIPFGYPIYESAPSNIAQKCEESGELTKEIVEYVNNNGGKNFFNKNNWKEELFSISSNFKGNKSVTYIRESEKDFKLRVKSELLESKRIIENNLDKKVYHVCWPFGKYNDDVLKLATECGYKTSSIKGRRNLYNSKQNIVGRIAIDNPKYQNFLFVPYTIFKLFGIKR